MNTQDLEAAHAVASRFVGYAARSRAEIVQRLEKAGFTPEIIEAVVADFEARGWVNDEAFARAWVDDRADRKKYGRGRLAAELRRKGVDKEITEEALNSVEDADELKRALAAARVKWKPEALADADRETLQAEKRRLANFLQRRGFSWEIILQVLAELMENKK